jgi:hypothetical protein
VAQGAGPEFKPQYCQKNKTKQKKKHAIKMALSFSRVSFA